MTLLDSVEHQTGPEPRWSILWLHGLGADGHDFAPIVPELLRAGWPELRFVFPHAPVRPVTINNGARMRAWYDIRNMEIDQRADEQGVRESIAQVEALVAREVERGVPPERILLAGFSQGGAIALAAGVRREAALGGLIALSTYLPMASTTAGEATKAGLGTPVFMAHGQLDPVVPESLGQRSRQALEGLGMAIDWHVYAMPHSVCAEEIRDLGDWMHQRFLAG